MQRDNRWPIGPTDRPKCVRWTYYVCHIPKSYVYLEPKKKPTVWQQKQWWRCRMIKWGKRVTKLSYNVKISKIRAWNVKSTQRRRKSRLNVINWYVKWAHTCITHTHIHIYTHTYMHTKRWLIRKNSCVIINLSTSLFTHIGYQNKWLGFV